MNTTVVRLDISQSTLEEIALDASALSRALGAALDKATAAKLRARKVAAPEVSSQGRTLFNVDGFWPETLWE